MVLPMVIRATFLISGMLGLKFGIGGGKQNSIEAQLPFNITLENQTIQVPSSILENISTPTTSVPTRSTIKSSRTRRARTFQLPGYDTKTTYDFALHGKCGPGRCKDHEICVTWIKDGQGRKGRESPMLAHECLNKQGDYHTKINPSGGGLCVNGEIHSIIQELQPCFHDEPPCPLVWKYKCVAVAGILNENN